MPNRLADSTSPYLLQHKDNPVDWQEWGAEAFAEARSRDVPVLLSVGYAACHWCHVMAHESFEDETVAAAVNADFVAVKVDREERPDIDAIYMSATTALTGHGGWPMTCFLTPDGDPFFAGTYYPKAQFLQLLAGVKDAWTTQRDRVLESGTHISGRLRELSAPAHGQALDGTALARAVEQLARQFDHRAGGFGHAPKFPPSMVLEFLLRHHARTGTDSALAMVEATCEAMARGGIYDQLAGGFARYSVDASWVVPHFEKMLYDNAQLLRVYTHLHRATGSPLARRVALETADFLLRDLGTHQGGFASALDADAAGVEGLTYAWTPDQLSEVLGDHDGRHAAELLRVTATGTFEHGSSTLQLPEDPLDPAWWADARSRLLAARAQRPQPARDDKVVTSWNGLAIAGLADAAVLFDEPRLLEAAQSCARLLLDAHLVDGRLRRASRDGRVGAAQGVADDYGNLAEGLLALHQATGAAHWLTACAGLLETTLGHFRAEDGGFYDTADDAEALFTRPRNAGDNAEPSGQSALAGALLTYAALTGSPEHRSAAEQALAAAGHLAGQDPRFAGWTLAVAEAALAGPLQVAVVGHDEAAAALLRVARRSSSPGLVLAHGSPDEPDVPLLALRPLLGGHAAAYVCHGFVCDAPVSEPAALEALLGEPLRAARPSAH
ncbi:thioredoxin domain-containing protein [Pedococcus sp. 5OH_020]|uniref:thioredoxin domain-containing protein n=1 Tax=Pedococcus sp. 5OH_020 TaxID=2989814 RepID=UPI0022E9AB63|nr:thioredoxin domain-containing protein [Pedococcus sp. 5OH_020]